MTTTMVAAKGFNMPSRKSLIHSKSIVNNKNKSKSFPEECELARLGWLGSVHTVQYHANGNKTSCVCDCVVVFIFRGG